MVVRAVAIVVATMEEHMVAAKGPHAQVAARAQVADMVALCLDHGPAPGAQLTGLRQAERASKRARRAPKKPSTT